MRDYILDFMEYSDYPVEARETLIVAFELAAGDAECNRIMQEITDEYEKNADMNYNLLFDGAVTISERIGVSEYTVDLLLFMLLTRGLRRRYDKRGFSEDMYRGAVLDLKWKLLECHGVKGVWGSFVKEWLVGWFRVARFAFGRLQYELCSFGREYEHCGVVLKPEDKAVFVHIPRSLEPLSAESVDLSLCMAREFFAGDFNGGQVVFCCSSWMLYPDNLKFLSPLSNTAKFAARFDIISSDTDDDGKYPNAWRVFNQEFNGDTSEINPTTKIGSALLEHYKRGGKMGSGFGILLM